MTLQETRAYDDIINDGDTEYSWDFILIDASSDERHTFDERLLRMLSDYIHAGFPDASYQQWFCPSARLWYNHFHQTERLQPVAYPAP